MFKLALLLGLFSISSAFALTANDIVTTEDTLRKIALSKKSSPELCMFLVDTYVKTTLKYTCDSSKKYELIGLYNKDQVKQEQVVLSLISEFSEGHELLSHANTAQKHGQFGRYTQTLIFKKK